MAFQSTVTTIVGLINQFGTPVAIANIGWVTYVLYTCACAILVVIYYFFMVETRGYTLEELDEVFAAPNPRKFSTTKRVVQTPVVNPTEQLKTNPNPKAVVT